MRAVISGLMRRALEAGAQGLLIQLPDGQTTVIWTLTPGGTWAKELTLPAGLGVTIASGVLGSVGTSKLSQYGAFRARRTEDGLRVKVKSVEEPEVKGLALTWGGAEYTLIGALGLCNMSEASPCLRRTRHREMGSMTAEGVAGVSRVRPGPAVGLDRRREPVVRYRPSSRTRPPRSRTTRLVC